MHFKDAHLNWILAYDGINVQLCHAKINWQFWIRLSISLELQLGTCSSVVQVWLNLWTLWHLLSFVIWLPIWEIYPGFVAESNRRSCLYTLNNKLENWKAHFWYPQNEPQNPPKKFWRSILITLCRPEWTSIHQHTIQDKYYSDVKHLFFILLSHRQPHWLAVY